MIKNLNKHQRCVNAIRFLGADAINKANSGHPGIVMGAAGMGHVLFSQHMNINSKNPDWINRDRFVLSAGHGSGLLYSLMHLSGYDISIEDMKQFRQLNSKTAGHPEKTLVHGIEATTGPLGQGIAMAVGMAIAEKALSEKYNKNDIDLIDHHTYVMCGDGCLQEGISYEAAALAGNFKLNKLILLFDSNDIQLDSPTSLCTSENIRQRFESQNWNYILVKDGENLEEINEAITKAKVSDKPTIIEVKTIIGIGSPKQGTCSVHGSAMGVENTNIARKNLGWDYPEFTVPNDVYHLYQEEVISKGLFAEKAWNEKLANYKNKYPEDFKDFETHVIKNNFEYNWKEIFEKDTHKKNATRNLVGTIFDCMNSQNHNLIGGSADLSGSTKIKGSGGNFFYDSKGRNIMFGVREFAMGAIVNGINLHKGMHAFGSTFLVFSDYLKPSIRLSSLMEINSSFIFSHDSIFVGEDGPTHQPIEQLTMLRSIPNTYVFRPASFNETVGSFKFNNDNKDKTFILVSTRQDVADQPNSCFEKTQKGGYILEKETKTEYITILASGSEVELGQKIKQELIDIIDVRIVSVPCLNLFIKQNQEYINETIGKPKFKFIIEMNETSYWNCLTNNNDLVFGINSTFGHCGPGSEVALKMHFDEKYLSKIVINKLK